MMGRVWRITPMSKKMLIDVAHEEESRVAVLSGNQLDEFDFETASKKQIKGNIYLAKVVRVEPSLQAAFVDYGGERHGFLSFTEVHPDYFRIPIADREKLLAEQTIEEQDSSLDVGEDEGDATATREGADDEIEELIQPPVLSAHRKYKIQEVIKRRQILLVQVTKEQRGNKGAALTTYLSLAGRYCVLMPNNSRGGGVSRKIRGSLDRRRLRTIISEFEISSDMAVIVRTAGAKRNKAEIKRDYEYLLRLWEETRQTTLGATAPNLIYEEANLIRRSIRDLYTNDISDIIIEGEPGYRDAKTFMKLLIPSHAKRVQLYKNEDQVPLFQHYQVEQQIASTHDPVVQLPSGGYIVIHATEALIAIDVNSGRAIRERHIEETALRTNLEAVETVAQQVRLRDLAGLVVIDFIDMEEPRNNSAVERKLHDEMRRDRARLQIGRISTFGLLEMSRQRLRPSLLETTSQPCHYCAGSGMLRSVETLALELLRLIEQESVKGKGGRLIARTTLPTALYVLNHKRNRLSDIEARYGIVIIIQGDPDLQERQQAVQWEPIDSSEAASDNRLIEYDESHSAPIHETIAPSDDAEQITEAASAPDEEEEPAKRRSRRPRRGRRSRRPNGSDGQDESVISESDEQPELDVPVAAQDSVDPVITENEGEDAAKPTARRPRRRRTRGGEAGASRPTARSVDVASDVMSDITSAVPVAIMPDVPSKPIIPVEPTPAIPDKPPVPAIQDSSPFIAKAIQEPDVEPDEDADFVMIPEARPVGDDGARPNVEPDWDRDADFVVIPETKPIGDDDSRSDVEPNWDRDANFAVIPETKPIGDDDSRSDVEPNWDRDANFAVIPETKPIGDDDSRSDVEPNWDRDANFAVIPETKPIGDDDSRSDVEPNWDRDANFVAIPEAKPIGDDDSQLDVDAMRKKSAEPVKRGWWNRLRSATGK